MKQLYQDVMIFQKPQTNKTKPHPMSTPPQFCPYSRPPAGVADISGAATHFRRGRRPAVYIYPGMGRRIPEELPEPGRAPLASHLSMEQEQR